MGVVGAAGGVVMVNTLPVHRWHQGMESRRAATLPTAASIQREAGDGEATAADAAVLYLEAVVTAGNEVPFKSDQVGCACLGATQSASTSTRRSVDRWLTGMMLLRLGGDRATISIIGENSRSKQAGRRTPTEKFGIQRSGALEMATERPPTRWCSA